MAKQWLIKYTTEHETTIEEDDIANVAAAAMQAADAAGGTFVSYTFIDDQTPPA